MGNMGVFDPTEIHNRGLLKSHMKEAMIKLGYHLLCFFIYLYRWHTHTLLTRPGLSSLFALTYLTCVFQHDPGFDQRLSPEQATDFSCQIPDCRLCCVPLTSCAPVLYAFNVSEQLFHFLYWIPEFDFATWIWLIFNLSKIHLHSLQQKARLHCGKQSFIFEPLFNTKSLQPQQLIDVCSMFLYQ